MTSKRTAFVMSDAADPRNGEYEAFLPISEPRHRTDSVIVRSLSVATAPFAHLGPAPFPEHAPFPLTERSFSASSLNDEILRIEQASSGDEDGRRLDQRSSRLQSDHSLYERRSSLMWPPPASALEQRRSQRRRSLPGGGVLSAAGFPLMPHLRQIAETDEEGETPAPRGSMDSQLPSSLPDNLHCIRQSASAGSLEKAALPTIVTPAAEEAGPSRLTDANRSGSEGVLFLIGGVDSPILPRRDSHSRDGAYFTSEEDLGHPHQGSHHCLHRLERGDTLILPSEDGHEHQRPGRKDARQEMRSSLVPPPSQGSGASEEGRDRERLNSATSSAGRSDPGLGRLRPHPLFVQLDELYIPCSASGDMEWRETGRWIKYEEAVEVGAERWGKPHVSSLSFHSLLELRRGLRNGYVDLGVSGGDWSSVVERLVWGLEETGQVRPGDAGMVSGALFLPHRHVDGGRGPALGELVHRRVPTYNSLHHYFYRQQSVVSPGMVSSRASVDASAANGMPIPASRSSFGLRRLSVSPKTPEELFVPNGMPAGGQISLIRRKLSQVPIPTSADGTVSMALSGGHVNGNGRIDITPASTANNSSRTEEEGLLLRPPTRPRRASTASWLGRRLQSSTKLQTTATSPHGVRLPSQPWLPIAPSSLDLLKVLPRETEAAMVLVGSVEFLTKPALGFLRLTRPFVGPQRSTELPLPIRFVFLLLGPLNAGVDYHEVGRSIATLLSNKHFREAAYAARVPEDIIHSINDFLDDSIVLPPWKWEDRELLPFDKIKQKSEWLRQRRTALTKRPSELDGLLSLTPKPTPTNDDDDASPTSSSGDGDPKTFFWLGDEALSRTGQLFGGVRRELRQRLPLYWSDLADAVNSKCATSLLFIFLSCFFLAVTFGAILNDKTKGAIGVKETLLATSGGGTLFALLSAQPVMLLGVSGPMLVFEESLFKLSGTLGCSFLGFRVWVAWWALLATVVTLALEGSFLIRFVTRFSDDILCTLLSVIFISESIFFLADTFSRHPIEAAETGDCNASAVENATAPPSAPAGRQPNVALLSLGFVVGTAVISVIFNQARYSRFFGRQIRRALADFGVSLAIILMVCLDKFVIGSSAQTEKVIVSEGSTPHLLDGSERPWLVQGVPTSGVLIVLAALPGMLLFLVLFLETEVVEVELAKREHGLQKGTGFHWDLLVSAVLLVACAHLGLPWLCGVPVRSMAHLHSLTEYQLRAPGQKPRVRRVVDQRVTGVVLHVLIGTLLLWAPLLRSIPVAVLFGVFLYIGAHNLQGVQMLSRALLFFVPLKYHPQTLYCNRVSRWRMYLFTLLQLCAFAGVCVVKSFKVVSFAFPLAVALTVLLRHLLLPLLFSPVELLALDGDGQEEDREFLGRLPI